jgi:hypothetical protein
MGAEAGSLEALNDRGDVEAVVECTPPPVDDCLFDGLNDALANARLPPIAPPAPDMVLHLPPLRRPTLKLEVVPVDRLAEEIPWLPRWRKNEWRVDPALVRRLRRWVAAKPAGWFTVGEAAELAEMNVAVPANKIGAKHG